MENKNKIWQDRFSVLKQNVVLVDKIFGREILDRNVWKWLGFMAEEMEEYLSKDDTGFDLDVDFRLAVYGQVDFALLEKINNSLGLLSSAVDSVPSVENSPVYDLSVIERLLSQLDIANETRELFLDDIESADSISLQGIKDILDKLAVDYVEFGHHFSFVAATLLYYMPEDQFNNPDDFERITKGLAVQPQLDNLEWHKVFRYMGQGFFSRDGYVKNWSVNFLTTTNITKDAWENFVDKLLFIIMLYASMGELKDLSNENKILLLDRYIWWALLLGIPVERLLEESLAEQPLFLDYVSLCGEISQTLSKSNQIMNFTGETKVILNQFVNNFIARSRGKELDGYQQVSYVEDFVKDNQYFRSYQNILIRLLRIYLHLREMDFVDYKGIFSDEGAINPKYDWPSILHNDINDSFLEELRRYFVMLRRPARLKVELIINFMKINWQEDPFLGRVLILDELYQDVFPDFGSLVYFDEDNDKWEFDREMPSIWMTLPDGMEIVSAADLSEEELDTFNKSSDSIL